MNNNDYEISFYKDKDLKKVSLHSHDFYELYYFINGNISYIIENAHYTLLSGDILLISPRDLHQLDIKDTKTEYERVVLWINPKYIKKLSTENTDLAECFELCNRRKDYLVQDKLFSESIKTGLKALYTCSKSDEYGADIDAEIIIKKMLLSLNKYVRNIKEEIASNESIITKTINYICENINGNLSLDNISEKMFLSKYYLARLFKEKTNTTIHQYIIKKRLILSKQFLETNLPISEVCIQCGFADYTHFFRAFKHEFGITPKQYLEYINN